VLVILLNIPAVSNMMSVRVSGNGLQSYDRVRFATHDLALTTAVERPFGIGPGQSEGLFGYATHSMYLRVLSENGFLALAGILVFVAVTAARAFRLTRYAESPAVREFNLVLFACIVGHLVNSDVIDTVHWRHIWLIYALAWTPAVSAYTVRARVAPKYAAYYGARV
jgi:O-antigen ligase